MTVTSSSHHDVVVIGAGFAGLYLIRKLRDDHGLDVKVYDRATDVGGTWYWNRYPGARCDVESTFYCYSFDEALYDEWTWTERYPAQPEILEYLNFVADRFDLRRSIAFDTTVRAATFDEAADIWRVETDRETVTAQYVVTAVGCLSAATTPDIAGLEAFQGAIVHTGEWPHGGVDFAGKRVAVVGTGSSGVQVIPPVAEAAAHLTVFQRTATFVVPARNRDLTDREKETIRKTWPTLRAAARHTSNGTLAEQPIGFRKDIAPEVLRGEFERRWLTNGFAVPATLKDNLISLETNAVTAQFVRDKINSIVEDPQVAKRLEPWDYPIATKRIVLDTGYYETFNRPNVELVSIRDTPIERLTERGLVVGGEEYEFDVIVLATGYDAMTGALLRMDIRGVGGRTLQDAWKEGAKSYLGIAVHDFPNMFTVTGPGSPSVFSNVVASIEQHVEWITNYIQYLRENSIARTDAASEAQEEWVAHVAELADATLFPTAASWYMGANIPGKPRVFMPYIGGVGNYRKRCDVEASGGYPGFEQRHILDAAAPERRTA